MHSLPEGVDIVGDYIASLAVAARLRRNRLLTLPSDNVRLEADRVEREVRRKRPCHECTIKLAEERHIERQQKKILRLALRDLNRKRKEEKKVNAVIKKHELLWRGAATMVPGQ